MMKLWLLQQKGDRHGEHGVVWQAIMRAETEEIARSMMGNVALKESFYLWDDPERSTCTELSADGPRAEIWVDEEMGW